MKLTVVLGYTKLWEHPVVLDYYEAKEHTVVLGYYEAKELTVVLHYYARLDYYEAKVTCSRIGLLRRYGNLQSYWTTTQLRKLTVVLD